MAIELELTVNDKGSAMVKQASDNMAASISHVDASAKRLDSTFGGLTGRLGNMVSRLFSMSTILGTISGAGGFGWMAKEIISAAGGTEELSSSWDTLKAQLTGYIKQSPDVSAGIIQMTKGVKDWGVALAENKDVVSDWSAFVVSATATAISAVGKTFSASLSAMSSLQKAVDYYSKAQVKADPGEFIPGFYEGRLPGELGLAGGSSLDSAFTFSNSAIASEMLMNMRSGRRVTYSGAEGSGGSPGNPIITFNVNQSLSRSDIMNILNEAARQEYRNATGASYEEGGEEQGW